MIRESMMGYLERTFLFEFGSEITESTDLFRAGIIDSYGYIQMLKYIRDEFGVSFSSDELLSSVIASLSGIVARIEAKRAVTVAVERAAEA